MTPLGDGTEPIEDDETVLRRVPVSKKWYSPQTGCSPEAFAPRPDEETGISLVREKYCDVAAAACGPSRNGYWVIRISARELRRRGIVIEPRPIEGSPGHVEIPALSYPAVQANSQRAEDIMVQLATELSNDAIGPFVPQQPA